MENKGKYTFEDNSTKIKVTTLSGQESVLFEDIASIGFSRMNITIQPHMKNGQIIAGLGLILGLIILFTASFWYGLMIGGIIVFIGIVVINFPKIVHFDRISIETKGGKIIPFDVPDGTAQKEVELIENKKRDLTGVK